MLYVRQSCAKEIRVFRRTHCIRFVFVRASREFCMSVDAVVVLTDIRILLKSSLSVFMSKTPAMRIYTDADIPLYVGK